MSRSIERRMAIQNPAMQERCIHCKKEQYAMAVYPISMGEAACPWCGKMSRKMSEEEYKRELEMECDCGI